MTQRHVSYSSPLDRLLHQDRLIALAGIAFVVLLAWTYLLAGAGIDMSMAGMEMDPMPWSLGHTVIVFIMWWVMMIAMMVPSATPTVLLFSTIKRKQVPSANASLEAWTFLLGYLLTWAAFSVVAVIVQWTLESLGWMSMEMASSSTVLGSIILMAAGLYQVTPLKAACLRYCQSPLMFLTQHWRSGNLGALKMGFRHGVYCVGCCWFLMALLFVSGIMNLLWIAGIALYIAFEKLFVANQRLSTAAGFGLIISGAVVLVRAAWFQAA
jgi:predicted metal-binding membrane protein